MMNFCKPEGNVGTHTSWGWPTSLRRMCIEIDAPCIHLMSRYRITEAFWLPFILERTHRSPIVLFLDVLGLSALETSLAVWKKGHRCHSRQSPGQLGNYLSTWINI